MNLDSGVAGSHLNCFWNWQVPGPTTCVNLPDDAAPEEHRSNDLAGRIRYYHSNPSGQCGDWLTVASAKACDCRTRAGGVGRAAMDATNHQSSAAHPDQSNHLSRAAFDSLADGQTAAASFLAAALESDRYQGLPNLRSAARALQPRSHYICRFRLASWRFLTRAARPQAARSAFQSFDHRELEYQLLLFGRQRCRFCLGGRAWPAGVARHRSALNWQRSAAAMRR